MKIETKKKIVFLSLCILFFYTEKIEAAVIPNNTTIYYDNTVTKWTTVSIYIWGADTPNYFIPWQNTTMSMNCVNYICSYELEHDNHNYDKIIFRGPSLDSQKTNDLIYQGPNHIFKSLIQQDSYSWSGSWYYKDNGELHNEKQKFNNLESEWYTQSSYNDLKTLILAIPSVYNEEYLIANTTTSQYQNELNEIKSVYQNLQLSPYKIETKINELENKNTNGYTWESIIDFRKVIDEVNNYLETNIFTLDTLKSNYNKLLNANKLLIIETEEGSNVVIEALKDEVNKLQELLNSTNSDIKDIIDIYNEIESDYKTLTNEDSKLSETVNKLLVELANSKNNTEIETLKKDLNDELSALTTLLKSDNIKVEELIKEYEKMENHYKTILNNNNTIEQLVLNLDKKISKIKIPNTIIYLTSTMVFIETAILILNTIKKRKLF